jgi:hypothetical protein
MYLFSFEGFIQRKRLKNKSFHNYGCRFQTQFQRVFHIAHLKGFSIPDWHSLFTAMGNYFSYQFLDRSCMQKWKVRCWKVKKAGAFNSVGKENNSIPIPSDVDKCNFEFSQSSPKTSYTFVQLWFLSFFHFGWFHIMYHPLLNRILRHL